MVEHCLLRFAGYNFVMDMDSTDPIIRDNEFEICTHGIRMINTSAPVVQDNLFRVLSWYPVQKSIIATPTFSGNVLDNVTYHCLGIIGESIGQNMTMQKWDFAGYTNITQALVSGQMSVQLGAELTIEPGVVLKMWLYAYAPFNGYFNIYGSLIADGTPGEPIVFTSILDDTVGNPADTNTDGAASSPAAGNWGYIYFDEVSDDATAILDNCVLHYGRSSASYGMVYCSSASPTLSNCDLAYAGHGVGAFGTSEVVIADCVFGNITSTPIRMSLTTDPQFSGNQFLSTNGYTALGIHGETLAQDITITSRDVAQLENIPYVMLGDITAGFSSILRIEPGVVIKSSGQNISIYRGLVAEGGAAPDSLIVFTSLSDDFYGGDTNNDGAATAPSAYRWGRIVIYNEAIDDSTRLRNAVFRYGYNSASYGTIEINSANPEIDDCTFAYNGMAIDYKGTAGDPAEGWVHGCDFLSNTYYAIRNSGGSFTVDAENNWWGHATGPLDDSDDTGTGGLYNPGGLGDPVSDYVDYEPWNTDGIENVLLGDVSRNGDIRAYDASLVLQELVAPGLLGPLQLVLGDVNCSGALAAMDASLILRYVAGIDTYFPCAFDSTVTKSDGWLDMPYVGTESITFEVDLPAVTLGPGESVWVPVQLSGSGDLYGQEYHILFDPEQVSVADVRLLPPAQGSFMAWNNLGGDELRIALASLQPLDVVDAVEFELVGADGLPGQVPVSIELIYARLNEEEYDGATGTGEQTPAIDALRLGQNHPNPFNPSTEIVYALPESLGDDIPVRLVVYDAQGRVVRELVHEVLPPGEHTVVWDGRDGTGRRVGSGIYLYRLTASDESEIRKMVLLK